MSDSCDEFTSLSNSIGMFLLNDSSPTYCVSNSKPIVNVVLPFERTFPGMFESRYVTYAECVPSERMNDGLGWNP